MEEKRNIQISLEDAREWYNSDDSFKKELALKAYSEKELNIEDYCYIENHLSSDNLILVINKNNVWKRLLYVATYLNKGWTKKPYEDGYFFTTLNYPTFTEGYKGYKIMKHSSATHPLIYFKTEELVKKAIDILGDELKILFK